MTSTAEKLKQNAPYNIFFNALPDFPETLNQKNSITFTDLLCPSLGELKCSLQLTFVATLPWLMEQYMKMGQGEKPLTVIYGYENDPETVEEVKLKFPNLTEHFLELNDARGIHHSKIGIYVYTDNSLRIVISSANLFENDWTKYCQSLWISPLCPPLPPDRQDTAGAGPTYFKPTLLSYLQHYDPSLMMPWINYIKRADFSAVRVCLVTSLPGIHNSIDWPSHCHLHRVGELLSLHCMFPLDTVYEDGEPVDWDILIQASSIGFMGNKWLQSTLMRSLASHKKGRLPKASKAKVNIIYPSEGDIENGHFGVELGSACLHYERDFYKNQTWLNNHMCHWKADNNNRTKAMPHSKSYCRISPCKTKLAWFLLTSANASRSAWGSDIRNGSSKIRSYEAGVLFLPKYFGKPYFQIKETAEEETDDLFPLIFDIPLTPYDSTDEPWCVTLFGS